METEKLLAVHMNNPNEYLISMTFITQCFHPASTPVSCTISSHDKLLQLLVRATQIFILRSPQWLLVSCPKQVSISN